MPRCAWPGIHTVENASSTCGILHAIPSEHSTMCVCLIGLSPIFVISTKCCRPEITGDVRQVDATQCFSSTSNSACKRLNMETFGDNQQKLTWSICSIHYNIIIGLTQSLSIFDCRRTFANKLRSVVVPWLRRRLQPSPEPRNTQQSCSGSRRREKASWRR